jgi:hypothetical protein
MMTKSMTYNDKLIYLRGFYNNGDSNACLHTLLRLSFLTIDEIKTNLNHKQNVIWTYKCASSVQHMIKDPKTLKAANRCLYLTRQWIEASSTSTKPTKKQMLAAADAAYNAAYTALAAAHYAAHAAHYAAHAALTTARAAAFATYTAHAARAADAAYYAAAAAQDAAHAAHDKKHQETLNLHYLIEAALSLS